MELSGNHGRSIWNDFMNINKKCQAVKFKSIEVDGLRIQGFKDSKGQGFKLNRLYLKAQGEFA